MRRLQAQAARTRASGSEERPDARVVLVFSNLPDAATAKRVADALVGERLAACVNLLAPCTSVYRWEGRVEDAVEVPLVAKTSEARVDALIERLAQLHPYEVPEAISVRVERGLPAYLSWVADATVPR